MTPAAWRVLAVTSGNDYAVSKTGFGPTKNTTLIKTICAGGATHELNILARYCHRQNMDPGHFHDAVNVFFNNSETLQPQAPATTALDDLYLDSVFRVGLILQSYRDDRESKRFLKDLITAPPYYRCAKP
ncbi:hypothetical protein BGZ70_006499, partial [Mortierella alpina]